ncbi:hypothetical protein POPTR_001G108450v4 [Populus trichocarpa]|uniref:Uncharacterized protein n=1 Tax=Populus trichocarpa TaxID=3694 RepID=A0ACC0TJ28_POPTR|nr:hypothetical protein POPTR_001G108450v4 [Populus trichocarpa]
MAFFPLFLFLLLLCFPVGCCFVAPLEEKELLRRKWLLLLWGSVEAGLKRSCWIVGENLVVLGGSWRCLTVVRKVAVYFQTVEGESRERAASKGSGAAACAWGAGDTKPGQPALLPTPEGLGQRHAHGVNGVYTILGFFFLFFIFMGIQKWVTTDAPSL